MPPARARRAVPARRAIPGSERPPARNSRLIGPADEGDRVAFAVLLRSRPGSPELPSLEHWQRTPPAEREFLTVEEFMERHGAADEDLEAVLSFLTSADLRVLEPDAGRRRVVAEGTVAQVNEAFGITLNLYRARRPVSGRPFSPDGHEQRAESGEPDEEEYRGFEGQVLLPSALADVVRAVIGLDNRRLSARLGTGTGDPPGANFMTPVAIAQLYNFPNLGAAGQTVGLFQDAPDGASYQQTDIDQFITNQPAGYNTPPVVTPVGVTVGGTTYGNGVTTNIETALDIEMVAAVAQGANINVYFTDTSELGWESFFNRAVIPPPGDNPPSVLSISWARYFDDHPASIGTAATPGSVVGVLRPLLQAAATRGITVFMAMGDWGAADTITDTHCHVLYPASDPYVTGCGGTIVGDISATTPTTFEEFTWSDAHTGSPFQGGIYVATGGGVSDNFAVPPFQVAAGLNPISKNDGNSRRGVPDVAGMVAVTGLVVNGGNGGGEGTSAVAPLYAGLTAVINGALGHSVGFINPTLYRYGPQICHDVVFGNNDSGLVPDSPFYIAGWGWDPCTGWGSINGLRLLAALAPAALIATSVTPGGSFGETCPASPVDQILTINNTGFAMLLISDIVSSSPDFVVASVSSYPLAVSPGSSIDVVIQFQPAGPGPDSATITILSNAFTGPQTVAVSAFVGSPRLVLGIGGNGNFRNTCVASFSDEALLLSNSGACTLTVTDITSTSAEFLAPEELSYPIEIAPGGFLPVPVRFAPTGFGPKAATITVYSNDPGGPKSIDVSGLAPAGKLAVTGSADFGEVDCGFAEKTIAICNTGECALHVTKVAFTRKRKHFRLVDNPFPATLRPGSCLGVVIRYEASCEPECCELVIKSDDPTRPTRKLDVTAFTRCAPAPCCPAPRPACECQRMPSCGCSQA
jgi:Pro-kumamolisin, activation domain/Protein of unknown function (DUF1573)